jgi:fatty-acyl-CoA synthase
MQVVIPTTALYRNREVIANYWRLVERHRATVLSAVPTVLAALANVPIDADISSLRYCRTGAAPLAPELAARFERLTGLHVHEALGMTEMAGISTITPPGVVAPAGCVGFRLPHSQLRIVALDDHGHATERELEAGETGMVVFKSPNVIPGFVDPKDNEHAFTPDGWLASGDLGWLDDAGRLHLTGRSKDLIIRSGHNIDPKVIEDALGAHPAVQLCAAIGAPDAYAGELPVVFATLLPGASATEAELLAFATERVDEAPARPKSVTIIERMPLTNVGKVYKPQLRAMAACSVVRALVDGVSARQGVAAPEVALHAEQRVDVRLDADTPESVASALREALERLPFPIQLTRR